MSRDGIRRRKKPEKNESSEGALKCICKKKDDRGMMIQCEACLIWQHTRCLGMEENSLPPHYICSACLKPTEPLPQKFDFISDAGLRKSFEEDLVQVKDKPKDVEVKRHRVFTVLEKQLIEKYFGRYVESKESKEKENIVSGVAMLLNCSLYGVGNLFKFLAEEITGANKDDDSSDEEEEEDPYKDWNLIKKNIYSDGIEALNNGHVLDTDMQEPVKLSIMRIDDEWGVVVRDPVEKNQYIAEYLGVWLAPRKTCVEDVSPNSRFILEHPFCRDICIDARRSGSTIRFVRRSCSPNTQFKEVIGPDNTRHLALFAIEPLAADTEITVAFDRNWKTYSCNIKCACDTSDCIVKEWYDKRSSLAAKLLDSFIKKKTLLKLKNASRNEPDSDADESESLTDQEEENEESEDEEEEEEDEEDEEEDEPRRNAKKKNKGDKKENVKAPAPSGNMSREERKLQLIMRSIEKMENRERMASMSGKKRKPETKSDKRRPSEESRKRMKTSEVPSTKTHVVKKERGTQNQKASRITSPNRNSTITSPRASEAKKVLVRTEKRRKSIGEVASPPPSSTDTPSSSSSSRVSPSSPSPPPTSTPNTTKFGKKAWLQEYEEKKQMSKSNSEVPTKNTSPTPTISISSSASSVPVSSPSTPSSFPLKKKMLDAFLSSTAQRTAEAESKPEKPEPSAAPKKMTAFDSQDRRDSVDSIPAFRSFSRDQTSSPKSTSSSPNTTQSPTKNGVTEDATKSISALHLNGKRTQGSSDGVDAMEIDSEVTPQQNSILYVSPQPPRNNISSRQAPIPRSPSPPRTNHSPPQHYASQPPVTSSLSPHKSYAATPPHPSFHHSSRPGPPPMAQGPMMNGSRPQPPYPNGRLQKPPPYPSGPSSYGNHNSSWSNGRVNGVIGASGVMRSHDRYIRRSDGYY